ncbi:gluconate 2-dehydrogenase subunit 3 family protein [Flavihumibacter sp. R14]|nr:gluconate 2-dehydrogenase subunit 3 family protein [Flavihumibacter soli]
MNRRDSLKAIGISTLSTALILEACKTGDASKVIDNETLAETAGRESFEMERIKKLRAETFFDEHEMKTITVLANIIIPADEVSGSASDAEVPAFIEFIVKDIPSHQLPMRGGLKWLDMHCLNLYQKPFSDCSGEQQLEVVNKIAYPEKAAPEMRQGVVFFNRMRNLTASGFYTSKIGIKDIGYVGNVPNVWTGVPADVLAQYGLSDV